LRRVIVALIALPAAMTTGAFEATAAENCMIGDAAICLSTPGCHWDGEKRGCYPGPAPARDACAAHEDQAICDGDVSLGCAWTAGANKCESKAN
jgi:hypothetical protein